MFVVGFSDSAVLGSRNLENCVFCPLSVVVGPLAPDAVAVVAFFSTCLADEPVLYNRADAAGVSDGAPAKAQLLGFLITVEPAIHKIQHVGYSGRGGPQNCGPKSDRTEDQKSNRMHISF